MNSHAFSAESALPLPRPARTVKRQPAAPALQRGAWLLLLMALAILGAAALVLFATFALGPLTARSGWARPITYPDGWTVMGEHNNNLSMLHADRTLEPFMLWGSSIGNAVGVMTQYDNVDDMTTAGLQATLGRRWNFDASQANLYLWGGAGGSRMSDAMAGRDNNMRASGWGGFSLDWETRAVMVKYQLDAMATENGPRDVRQSARVGWAPWLAESGELQTWVLFQVDQRARQERPLRLMPMLRQSYLNHLWEVGVSLEGDVALNYTTSF